MAIIRYVTKIKNASYNYEAKNFSKVPFMINSPPCCQLLNKSSIKLASLRLRLPVIAIVIYFCNILVSENKWIDAFLFAKISSPIGYFEAIKTYIRLFCPKFKKCFLPSYTRYKTSRLTQLMPSANDLNLSHYHIFRNARNHSR